MENSWWAFYGQQRGVARVGWQAEESTDSFIKKESTDSIKEWTIS